MFINKNNDNINLEGLKKEKYLSINGNSNTISIGDSCISLQINGNGNTIFLIHDSIQLNVNGNGNNVTCLQSQVKVQIQGNGNQFTSESGNFTCLSCNGFGNNLPQNNKVINNKNQVHKSFSNNTNNNNNYNQNYSNDFVNIHNFQSNGINSNPNNLNQMQYNSHKNINGPFQNIFGQNNGQNQQNFVSSRNQLNSQINQVNFLNNYNNSFKDNAQRKKQMEKYNQRIKRQQQKNIKQQQNKLMKNYIKKREYSPMEIQQEDFSVIGSQESQRQKQIEYLKKQQQRLKNQMSRIHQVQELRNRQVQQNMGLFGNKNQPNHRQNANRQRQIQPKIQKEQDEQPLSQTQITRIPVSPHTGQEVQCTICLLQIYKNDQEMYLSCFHSFHAYCVSSWLKKSAKCPICNQSVRKGFKHNY